MRPPVDEQRIRELARRLGRVARGRVRIYLTGGATAVLEGWRESTIDVDLRFEPEADELLRELPALKERLGVNIELASPPDFIPELPDWRARSPLVFRDGNVDVSRDDPRPRTRWLADETHDQRPVSRDLDFVSGLHACEEVCQVGLRLADVTHNHLTLACLVLLG